MMAHGDLWLVPSLWVAGYAAVSDDGGAWIGVLVVFLLIWLAWLIERRVVRRRAFADVDSLVAKRLAGGARHVCSHGIRLDARCPACWGEHRLRADIERVLINEARPAPPGLTKANRRQSEL